MSHLIPRIVCAIDRNCVIHEEANAFLQLGWELHVVHRTVDILHFLVRPGLFSVQVCNEETNFSENIRLKEDADKG